MTGIVLEKLYGLAGKLSEICKVRFGWPLSRWGGAMAAKELKREVLNSGDNGDLEIVFDLIGALLLSKVTGRMPIP